MNKHTTRATNKHHTRTEAPYKTWTSTIPSLTRASQQQQGTQNTQLNSEYTTDKSAHSRYVYHVSINCKLIEPSTITLTLTIDWNNGQPPLHSYFHCTVIFPLHYNTLTALWHAHCTIELHSTSLLIHLTNQPFLMIRCNCFTWRVVCLFSVLLQTTPSHV